MSSILFKIERVATKDSVARTDLVNRHGFGEVFTDHMITIEWTAAEGWHGARLGAFGPLSLSPAAHVFHYGQEVFEGLKAFQLANGEVGVFRPWDNARRFQHSCRRMAMPELPAETFVEALDLLISADAGWIPSGVGSSLYLRPFMIATQDALGLYGRSNRFLFVVIATPFKGGYFKGADNGISTYVVEDYVRAVRGGTGGAKCGGNYAGSILAQEEARQHGCDQVIWLDAAERRWVEEMGTSNIFFVQGGRLLTPRLTDSILSGITRDTVIGLARAEGIEVAEVPVAIEDVCHWIRSGTLTEAFSSGTSASITPIRSIRRGDQEYVLPVVGGSGSLANRVKELVVNLHTGQADDRFGWLHLVGQAVRPT